MKAFSKKHNHTKRKQPFQNHTKQQSKQIIQSNHFKIIQKESNHLDVLVKKMSLKIRQNP